MRVSKKSPAPAKNEQLIPIIQSPTGLPMVDLRILHQRLGVKTRFDMWISRRIEDYGFLPQEFYTTHKIVRNKKQLDYYASIDMAKELAMLEKNEVGRRFRRYFIEAEKELRAVRMYAQVSSISEIKKKMKPERINGREMYPLRRVREVLGYSTKASSANVKRCNAGLVVKLGTVCYVAEEYVKYMISLSTSRSMRMEAREAQPVLPLNFGDTSNLRK